MDTKLVVKDWKVETRKGERIITGNYAVMLGDVELAAQQFNGEYGGVPINFEREIMDKVKEVTASIENSIQTSFTN